jgi:protein-S-isoprenylcysteine O-methyltransferase Ste14
MQIGISAPRVTVTWRVEAEFAFDKRSWNLALCVVYDVSYTTEVEMITLNVHSTIGYVWEGLGLVWLIGLAFTKRTVRSQTGRTRLFQMAVFLLGFLMVGSDWFRKGWLGVRFIPESYSVEVLGLALTVSGCLFAICARLTLGGNWSGRATVKDGHELIVKGPYSLARHPIYTGLLLGCLGTTLAFGEWGCVLGLFIIVIGLLLKMSQEEKLMMETFPEAYSRYRHRVKALIPGVL